MDTHGPDLKAQLKQRLFDGISAHIDAIGHVPADLARLAGDAPLGGLGPRPEPASDGREQVAAADGPDSGRLAVAVNRHYDDTFYSRDGIMGLLLGETQYRNIGYWDASTKTQHQASERLQDALLALLPEKTGRILDVACGLGASTRRLLDHYRPEDVWAINISEKQIETTRANAPGCNAQVMNAVEMSFRDGFFDAVLCIEAAFHFETRRRFLEEAYRVLAPGGHLVLSDVLFTSRERLAQYPVFPSPENHLESVEEYRALLSEVGFHEIHVEDARDEIWRAHFLHVVERLHEEFGDGRLDLVRLTDALWTYYHLDAITGPCLLVGARK
ncbi:MAG: class I SAM-dependent methyltransferase [Tistlia sp.]|uniref:class I SAM-dependent methyltransferase n=1 Tax=Tistlia sp. TaxID=3057121 RepID=UPI0034A4BD5B